MGLAHLPTLNPTPHIPQHAHNIHNISQHFITINHIHPTQQNHNNQPHTPQQINHQHQSHTSHPQTNHNNQP